MKIVKKVCIFVLIFVLAACKQMPGRGGILSYNDMKQVMWDLAKVDEYSLVYIRRDTTKNLQVETSRLYQKVFRLHNTDSAHFFNSFDYYKKHPDQYKILLDSLSALATRERQNRFLQAPITIPRVKAVQP